MSNVPIPENSLLEAVGAIAVAVFGWLLRLERRPRGMTREEHDEICKQNNTTLTKSLDEVKTMLRAQDERREVMIKDITQLKISTAIIRERQTSGFVQDTTNAGP